MQWPEKPTCHKISPVFKIGHDIDWRPINPEYKDRPYRTCSYCGSIHPEDLLALIEKGATLGGADWKYGWPHKFYIKDAPPGVFGKWYNDHLTDTGYDDEARNKLFETIKGLTQIDFFFEDSKLHFRAPRFDHQP